jgi:hypothetical protein
MQQDQTRIQIIRVSQSHCSNPRFFTFANTVEIPSRFHTITPLLKRVIHCVRPAPHWSMRMRGKVAPAHTDLKSEMLSPRDGEHALTSLRAGWTSSSLWPQTPTQIGQKDHGCWRPQWAQEGRTCSRRTGLPVGLGDSDGDALLDGSRWGKGWDAGGEEM